MVDYVIDIETDGIDATKIHCMSICQDDNWIASINNYADMKIFFANLNKDDRIIGHNFIRYDAPTIERILDINIPCKIIDTLALSWYLYPENLKHGLEEWGNKLGIKKVEITSWTNLSVEEYIERCEQDVRINLAVWKRFKKYLNYLYNDNPERLLRYLSFKMECAAEQEAVGWGFDTKAADALARNLSGIKEGLTKRIESALPKVPKYVMRKKPANMYKKNGELSAAGERWKKLCEVKGFNYKVYVGTIKELHKWEEPNASSTPQIKDWLFKLGWKPKTFKYPKDKEKIPQIKNNKGELCKSIIELAEKYNATYHVDIAGGQWCDMVTKYNKTGKAILALGSLAVVSHRLALVKSLIDSATWTEEHGWRVKAEIQGLTNTLRFKHKTCVNIPSTRAEYGKQIRELFIPSKEGNTLCGSDMSSLEDRTKQHYMWDYDPEYVKEMQVEDFDPHLDLAFSAGVITEEDIYNYKYGLEDCSDISEIRHAYKGGNYACTYGCGVTTLARQLGISQLQAEEIHSAYWKRNWSIKEIAAAQKIHTDWMYNPVSKLWYKIRNEKDIFSTLNQGTGVYCFDLWIKFIRDKGYKINAQFHDEIILETDARGWSTRDVEKDLKDSVGKVNNLLKLNRELDCDVQFGKNYSQIH